MHVQYKTRINSQSIAPSHCTYISQFHLFHFLADMLLKAKKHIADLTGEGDAEAGAEADGDVDLS
jgi:hypothetical protein